MPCLRIQTNVRPESAAASDLPAALSKEVAATLGKNERCVIVALGAGAPMPFAGTDAPLAYLELKSIGLPARTGALSLTLCRAVGERPGVAPERIYIEFADAPAHLWD